MSTDINAIRRTRREFQTFLELSDAFARAQQLSGLSTQLVAAGAKEEAAAVNRLNSEFSALRNEILQADTANDQLSVGLEKTADSADVAARRLSEMTRQTRSFQDAESSISGLVRGAGRIPGVDPGAAILVAELAGAPRDLARLSEALGSMKDQARAAASAIGIAGFGLIAAIAALGVAALIGGRRVNRLTEQLEASIERQQEYFALIAEGTTASIQQQRNALQLELELAQKEQERADTAFAAAREQIRGGPAAAFLPDVVGREIAGLQLLPILGDVFAGLDGSVARNIAEFNTATEALNKANDEITRIGTSLHSTREALDSSEVAINSENENRKQLNIQLGEQLRLENEAAVARKQAFADAQPGIQRERRERFGAGIANFASNLFGGIGDTLSGAGEGVTDIANRGQAIRDKITDIQFASAQRLARIDQTLNDKRAEAAIRLNQKLETASRASNERRLKVQENFQAALLRIQRRFARSFLNAVGERDSLGALMAEQQRDDALAEQQEQASRQLSQQKRSEAERERIIHQSNQNTLRVALQSAQRQASLEVQRARQNIAAKQQELQVLSIFRQRGTQEIAGFVSNALGLLSRLGSVAGTQTTRGGTTTTSTKQVNNQIDARIVKLISGGAGTPPPIVTGRPS